MIGVNASWLEISGMFISFILTLFVFSYFLGDNILFRIAIYIFIGVSAAYALVVAFYNIIWPDLLLPMIYGSQTQRLLGLIPFIFSLLLFAKTSRRFSVIGTPSLAYLVGVGAAAAVGGAVFGTLIPQIQSSINVFDVPAMVNRGDDLILGLVNGGIVILGTLTTLGYFHFGVRSQNGKYSERSPWMQGIAWLGQIFIAITFGVLFSGVLATALTAMVERLFFLFNFLFSLFS